MKKKLNYILFGHLVNIEEVAARSQDYILKYLETFSNIFSIVLNLVPYDGFKHLLALQRVFTMDLNLLGPSDIV